MDRTKASNLAGVRPPSAARLLAWVDDLVADGTAKPASDGTFVLAVSQAELARRLGFSATSGSVSKRLSALERMGVLVARDPPVFVLDDVRRQQAAPPVSVSSSSAARQAPSSRTRVSGDHGSRPAAPADRTPGPDRLSAVIDLLHQVCFLGRADLFDQVLEVARSELVLAGPAGVRPGVRQTRAEPAPIASRSSRSEAVSLPSSLPSSLSSSLPSSLPSSPAARPVPGGRYRFPPTADAAARLQALAPLLADCARRGLPGMNSPAGLLDAFDGYSLAQIERGVEFVRSQLAAFSPLRSPVGFLAHMARSGDLALVEHVPLPPAVPAVDRREEPSDRVPSEESPADWLSRMGALMRSPDLPVVETTQELDGV